SNGFWKQVEKMGQKLLTIRNGLNLISGSPTNEFNFQNGVRQGYPLSPFLFIIAEEALNVALIEARSKGIFKGVQVSPHRTLINHLQFADDALFLASVMDDIRRNLGGTKDLMYMPKFKGVWSSIAKVRREANHLGIPLITSFQRQIVRVGNEQTLLTYREVFNFRWGYGVEMGLEKTNLKWKRARRIIQFAKHCGEYLLDYE
ncbi:hypothetical protein Tco_1431326, partial [Tanacetum coccineum]